MAESEGIMKRLNGQPVVQFMMCVSFAMEVTEAEVIVAKSTEADKLVALKQWLLEHPCDDPLIYGITSFETFYTAYGKALTDKRAQELKMLVAPAPAPHPEDVENL